MEIKGKSINTHQKLNFKKVSKKKVSSKVGFASFKLKFEM